MKVQCTFRRQNRVLHLLAARICRLRQIPHPQCNLVSFAALGVGNPRQEIPDARCDGWIDDRRPHHLRPFLCRRGTKRFRTLSRPVLSASFAPGVALHGRAQRRVGGTKRPVITPPPLAIEIRSCGARARNRSPPLHLLYGCRRGCLITHQHNVFVAVPPPVMRPSRDSVSVWRACRFIRRSTARPGSRARNALQMTDGCTDQSCVLACCRLPKAGRCWRICGRRNTRTFRPPDTGAP